MKHHLRIIIFALRLIFIVAVFIALENIFTSVLFVLTDDPDFVKEYFSDTFTPIVPQSYHNNQWFAAIFTLLYGFLVIYGIKGVLRFYMCMINIQKGKMFYDEQSQHLKNAGANIIIFAKLKYLLFCTMGAMTYFDIFQFFKQLPYFLGLYLIGKLILLYSYMAEKGEFIREENDLTV